jgi:hypothetical protein
MICCLTWLKYLPYKVLLSRWKIFTQSPYMLNEAKVRPKNWNPYSIFWIRWHGQKTSHAIVPLIFSFALIVLLATNWQYTLWHKLTIYFWSQTGSILLATNWQYTLGHKLAVYLAQNESILFSTNCQYLYFWPQTTEYFWPQTGSIFFSTNWQCTLLAETDSIFYGRNWQCTLLAETDSILYGRNWQCTLLAETDLLDCSPQENETIEFPLLFLCILPFQQHRSIHNIEYNKLEKNWKQ